MPCLFWTRVLLLVGVVATSSMIRTTHGSSVISTVEVTAKARTSTTPSSTATSAPFNPYNDTEFVRNLKRNVHRAPSFEKRQEEARRRRARLQERRTKARHALKFMSEKADRHHKHNDNGHRQLPLTQEEAEAEARGETTSHTATRGKRSGVHRLTQEEVHSVQRKTSWFGNSDGYAYNAALSYVADPTQDYDKWAQAYRMLGAFIDCDHDKDAGSQDNGDGGDGCSRWMMWAAYVNPNYQGYEYEEYFGDEPYSTLDCHSPDTEWELIGVYRQEFYQFIEQISKHLWAIDDYEYIVARAGLMYMTDDECFQVGQDKYGNAIKASIQPQSNGRFKMALYSDDYCLEPDDSLGTYDDYVAQTDVDLGSKDQGDGQADDLYDWWYDTQEYTLTKLNDVYEEYMYCTPCMDYPTYQDGYFIGDYGTDDDDLINQCWKFHSHDSYICEGECIAMGHSQGSINQIMYGDQAFGSKMTSSSYYASETGSRNKADMLVESSWSRIMANAFLTFSFLLFVATFLAFAVARRSRYRESRSSKSRRLLDDGHLDDDGGAGHRSVRSRRSRSRKKKRGTSASRRSGSSRPTPKDDDHHRGEEGDGLFRTSDNETSERGGTGGGGGGAAVAAAAAAATKESGGKEKDGKDGHRSRSRSHRSKSRTGSSSKRGRSKSESKKRSSSRKSKDRNAADPPSRKSRSHALHDDNF